MIHFEKTVLENGLRVIVDHDPLSPLVAVNLLYQVGSRDEKPSKTGFAHLFEHLMFGGSKNAPEFDYYLQRAGGENNAFTNNDITNYYVTLPRENIETALWLESDRMLALNISPEKLAIQQKVVLEEYNQRYRNQPYGDSWSLLRPLAYQVHPYRWPTIGADISHVANASIDEVEAFYKKYYTPNNAILSLSGNIEPGKAFDLAKKWFGDIPAPALQGKDIPGEPVQDGQRFAEVTRDVPLDAFYMAFHVDGRASSDFHPSDLLTDILSSGNSSRLYQKLVKDDKVFNDINCFITGDIDPGLLVVAGKLNPGTPMEKAREKVWEQLDRVKEEKVEEYELVKVQNKAEFSVLVTENSSLYKAMNLAYYEMLGDAGLWNQENQAIQSVTRENIQAFANKTFVPENSSVLYYRKK
jgi:predicted Zn-dependent peptidase